MSTALGFTIPVTVTTRANMERQLDEAMAFAITRAMEEGRQGILVTRSQFGSFMVALSDAVPFGQTYERQLC